MLLTVAAGPDQGRSFDTRDGHVTLGRGRECEVVLSDPGVASQHALVEHLPDGRAVLRDLGSRNGTTVSGRTVTGPVVLAEGDRIGLGGTVVAVALQGAGTGPVPASALLPTAAPALAPSAARRQNWWLRLGLIAMGLLGLVTAGAEVAAYGPETYLVAFIASVVPMPVLVLLVLRGDQFEPEPPRMLAFAFAWGAIVATAGAGFFNAIGYVTVGGYFGSAAAGEVFAGSVSAPIVEETLKAAALGLIVWRRRSEFNGVIDGIVYASMVGLGFALVENIGYYAQYQDQIGSVIVARGVFSPFAHPLFTSMTGIGLAMGLERRNYRAMPALVGLGAAMGLHAIWNTSALFPGAFVAAYLFFFVPVFFALLWFVRRAVRSEGDLIRRHLQPEVGSGALSFEEVEALASIPARRQAVRLAAMDQGDDGKRAARSFQHAAVELAMARHRAVGSPQALEAEERWTLEIQVWRARLLPPVAMPAVMRMPAGWMPRGCWAPDPSLRFELRYWDGHRWSDHVAAHGWTGLDPGVVNPAAWHPDPSGRHEVRFWDGERWTEHVADHGRAGVDWSA